jgi:hypothetical protein
LSALLTAALVSACSVVGGKAAPEPDYAVVKAEEPFELRDYPELVLVKTAMSDGTRGSFGRLFDYISGANGGQRKIAMTAPVLERQKGDRIAMTAPVLRAPNDGGEEEMAFILPQDLTRETAPLPTDPAVTLGVIPPRRVAVVRFSGSAGAEDVASNLGKLEDWMSENGLVAAGPPELAQYNPPWTVPAFRRNELIVPVVGR